MDKKTFLEELKKSLRVLKEEELEDIIGEYEQHIDMKIEKGLTVEQAIADFGNIKELAAEILEAYHVRAEYSLSEEWDHVTDKSKQVNTDFDGAQEEKNVTEPVREKKVRFWAVFEWLNQIRKKISACISRLLVFIWSMCSWCGNQMKRPFRWGKEKWLRWKEQRALKHASMQEGADANDDINIADVDSMKDESVSKACSTECVDDKESTKNQKRIETKKALKETSENPAKQKKSHSGNWTVRAVKGMGNMIHNLWTWLIHAVLWCLRICWNCVVIGTAVVVGSFGLVCLFAAGVLLVLWMQGYPLVGLTVGCLGLVFCLFSGAALIWTFMWHRAKMDCAQTENGQMEGANLEVANKQFVEEGEGQHA